jgi:hypothetical protein
MIYFLCLIWLLALIYVGRFFIKSIKKRKDWNKRFKK